LNTRNYTTKKQKCVVHLIPKGQVVLCEGDTKVGWGGGGEEEENAGQPITSDSLG
jgi:hypothetical protein